eukprot:7589611-Pyramimonas_sp.AAC.1
MLFLQFGRLMFLVPQPIFKVRRHCILDMTYNVASQPFRIRIRILLLLVLLLCLVLLLPMSVAAAAAAAAAA